MNTLRHEERARAEGFTDPDAIKRRVVELRHEHALLAGAVGNAAQARMRSENGACGARRPKFPRRPCSKPKLRGSDRCRWHQGR